MPRIGITVPDTNEKGNKPLEPVDRGERQPPRTNIADTLSSLGSSRESGLTSAAASARLRQDGANDVPEPESHPFLSFARKFWGCRRG